ncbi:hypothetical protein BIW53_07605 [Pseudoalteromonas byunsanensis]|uniref:Uncharacterized protein n=2 Tax=Pseudoalteromonas byunsanensis TaxID=327939 RepID=A0A1S1N8D9_9GAMM|nr:hypothetical protein BIW53_07605 [Pseudoalteromonas byunsanensis]
MHIDTLSMYFDEREINTYLIEKGKILERLEEHALHSETIPEWAYLDFEQILAHESYHIYQTLTCSLLSEYSEAKRREALVALRLLARDIGTGNKLSPSMIGLRSIYENPQNEEEEQYFSIIKKDRTEAIKQLYSRPKEGAVNVFEVIEGGAVAFQLLAQNDLTNERVKLEGKEYSIAWDTFSNRYDFDYSNEEALRYSRLTFLFLTDVYLKSKNVMTTAVTTFEEAVDLVSNLVGKLHIYKKEFVDLHVRDFEFMKSLQHVERDESNIESILDFCGTLDEDKYLQFYINIRLYSDVYKCVVPAGFPTKKVTLSNKNRAINYYLKEKFAFWDSNFCIPCILSNYTDQAKFTVMWTEFSHIQFIDDTTHAETSFENENFLLKLYDELALAILPIEENRKVQCCAEHGARIRNAVHKCMNEDSLNSKFIKAFNRSIAEIFDYE